MPSPNGHPTEPSEAPGPATRLDAMGRTVPIASAVQIGRTVAELRALLEDFERIGAAVAETAPINVRDLERLVVTTYDTNEQRSIQRVRAAFRLHVCPFFEGVPIEQYPRRAAEYIVHRRSGGYAPGTIRYELACLRRGLVLAYRSQMIPSAPYIPAIRVRNARAGFVSDAQFEKLRRALKEPVRSLATFAFLTGWRISEVRSLAWSQVDREAKVIRIERTKNDTARTLPYSQDPDLNRLIERWNVLQEDDCPFVFHRNGDPIKWIGRHWRTACKAAGVEGLLFHDLRRSAVRNMERAGVARSVAMKITGHKTESVYSRYAIVNESDVGAAFGKLAAAREAAKGGRP